MSLVQGRLYWLQRTAPPIPDSGPFPPLQPVLEIVSLSPDGGAVQKVNTLPESDTGEVLGIHENDLYVTAFRTAMPEKYCIYRVPMKGDPAVRLVGEPGNFHALLTKSGALYWTTHSSEVTPINSALCVKRFDSAGKSETLLDWLSGKGSLYETPRGVFYVSVGISGKCYALSGVERFPEPVPMPKGFIALAAEGDTLFCAHQGMTFSEVSLHEMPLP